MYVSKVNFTADNAPQLFSESLRDTGFAVITHHPLEMGLVDAVYKEWEVFFASDYKNKYEFNPKTHDGYFPMSISETAKGYDVKDIKEYYHYHAWAALPEELSDKTKQLFYAMSSFAGILLKWLEQNMPKELAQKLSQPLCDMITNCPKSLLRILHYPPLSGTEAKGAIRAAAHEDINLITVLPAATSPGLQVQDTKGHWHDVPCDPGSIVINSGDMLGECTGGYYKPTTHRVCNPNDESTNESRFSMPFFLHPRDEVVLSERHTSHSYWLERMRELGVLVEEK